MTAATPVEVVFLCLARDCAATLPGFLAFTRALAASGTTNLAIIGENGSRDATRQIIAAAAGQGGVQLADTSNLAAIPNRYLRLAAGREQLKQLLDMSDLKPRFVCVADVDAVMVEPPSAADFNAALRLLDSRDDLFAAGATSRPLFYDILAYEDDQLSYADLPRRTNAARQNLLTYHRFVADNVYSELQRISARGQTTCVSSFNGMCVYKYEMYKAGSYVANHADDICEHLTLNRAVAAASRRSMIVTPLMTLTTPPEHMPAGPIRFWWIRTRRAIRAMLPARS